MKRNKFILVMIIGSLCFFGMINVDAATVSNPNIIVGYTYNETNGATDYCVTGEEPTCKQTECYKNKTADSCPSGTIIKYQLDDIVKAKNYFYVLHDDGNTLTMQERENRVYKVAWYSSFDNTKGPLTILESLEAATIGWSNVNDQTYTMGTTIFKDNAYTGCTINGCDRNIYTLENRTAKVRMITMQELISLGCSENIQSCPKWVYNYLNQSTSYGGTKNNNESDSYWTMSAYTGEPSSAWCVYDAGTMDHPDVNSDYIGARAVVEIDKYSTSDVIINDNETPTKENNNNNKNGTQTVDVEDTFKTAYIGYCIGTIILIFGIMVIYQSYRKEKQEIKIKKY